MGPAAAAEAHHHKRNREAHPRCVPALPGSGVKCRCFIACPPASKWQGCGRPAPTRVLCRAVPQCDKPSAEEVDRLHARFTRDIVALFDAHKHLLPGWEAKQLHIV